MARKQQVDLADLAEVTGSRRATPHEPAEKKPRTREGTRSFTVHIPDTVRQQIMVLAAEQDLTIQSLFFEAINDLFAKHGKPEICPMKERTRSRKEGQG